MRAQAAPASGRDGRGILARLRTPTAPRESMTYTGTSMAHPHDISLRPATEWHTSWGRQRAQRHTAPLSLCGAKSPGLRRSERMRKRHTTSWVLNTHDVM